MDIRKAESDGEFPSKYAAFMHKKLLFKVSESSIITWNKFAMIDVRAVISPRYISLCVARDPRSTFAIVLDYVHPGKHKKRLKLMLNLFSVPLFPASRIRYEITSGNIGGAFAVKNMTGAIYVAGALDYETRKRVSIKEKSDF